MEDANNVKTLNLYPIDYPFETLVARINTNPPKLVLDPEFQRKYKWDKEGWVRASRFIESCLMRIPLPSCYFAEDEGGKHFVIDGVQRLTTIQRYLNDEFALEGLTAFKELEGKRFSEIGDFQAELESTTIRCIVLRKENPRYLVREIFSRLNQGAVKLSDQEIRHAVYPGSLDKLLGELSQTPLIERFGLAESSEKVKDSREPEEQVLRFLAFKDDIELETFEGSLRKFLDDYMEENSENSDQWVDEQRKVFQHALSNCELVFGDDVFTNPAAKKRRKGLVHYDLLMPTAGLLNRDVVENKAENIRNAYEELCRSEDFRRTLSGGLQNKSSIIRRRELWSELLEKAVA
ncbi:DUF262 domain-containing protein [Chromohalobacter canadensis]|uniref:DUF262 domain-containing protein n=1 Tax=Chromohalobacter canadensis TaxID=141389 RepID=A0ABZ0YD46_9GAMM|nr:DUF262 domain-containing protein [Chromohalobacter canadensis]MCK0767396.1 DUF262 domain-containing protein [Chromohalobacter canadensis]WQH10000.1 DUF262 domain-containing protein [Chromohalobacter canadensis]